VGVPDDVFHVLMLALVLPTSAGALALGCRRHRDAPVVALGALGLAALGLAILAGHDALGEAGERLVTMGGALVVAAAHVRNFQLCRRDRCHS
jgi:MerC mercury resistance protein